MLNSYMVIFTCCIFTVFCGDSCFVTKCRRIQKLVSYCGTIQFALKLKTCLCDLYCLLPTRYAEQNTAWSCKSEFRLITLLLMNWNICLPLVNNWGIKVVFILNYLGKTKFLFYYGFLRFWYHNYLLLRVRHFKKYKRVNGLQMDCINTSSLFWIICVFIFKRRKGDKNCLKELSVSV